MKLINVKYIHFVSCDRGDFMNLPLKLEPSYLCYILLLLLSFCFFTDVFLFFFNKHSLCRVQITCLHVQGFRRRLVGFSYYVENSSDTHPHTHTHTYVENGKTKTGLICSRFYICTFAYLLLLVAYLCICCCLSCILIKALFVLRLSCVQASSSLLSHTFTRKHNN